MKENTKTIFDFASIKYAIAEIQFHHLQMSEDGKAIEANPATHRIAQLFMTLMQSVIGEPLEGEHPDEINPRAENFLAERRNWEAEVALLKNQIPTTSPYTADLQKEAEALAEIEYPLENARKNFLHDNPGQYSRRKAFINGFIRARQMSMQEKRRIVEATIDDYLNEGLIRDTKIPLQDWIDSYLNNKYPLPE